MNALEMASVIEADCPFDLSEAAAMLRRQHEEIQQLKDRLEAAEKDAARYRAIAADPYFDGYAWWTQDICIIETDDANKPPTKDQVDEAVDALMKDEQK